jgi:hypothetical protein
MQDRNNVWSVNQIDLDRVQLSTSWIDGATSNIAINGNAPVTVGSGGAFTINGYTVGNNIATDDPNSPLYGSISEIVVFNIALSKGQRQQIEGYLAWKWEIQAQLPSSHPYKNSAPGKTLPPVTVTGQINIGDVGMPPGHIYPEPYGLIVSTSVGGSSFNTIRNGIKAGTSYEITVTSNTGAKVTTPLTAINTDGGFYTTMNTPINMKTTFPIPPTRSLAISISPISTNSPTIMFGPWIGKDTPIQSVSTLMSGETVYMIETELHTKMVTESGVAKYYNGKMSDFNANNWNTYYDAAGNYKIR